MRAPITIFIEQPNVPNLDALIDSLIKTHDEFFARNFVNKTLLIDPQTMDDKVIKAYQIWSRMDVPSHHRLYLEHKTETLEEKKEYSEKIDSLEQECHVPHTPNDNLKEQKKTLAFCSERSKSNMPIAQTHVSTEQKNELARLSKQNSDLRTDKENITRENDILKANLEETSKKLEFRESELQELRTKIVSFESEIKQLENLLSQEKKSFEEAQKKLSDLHEKEQKARDDFHAATKKIQFLQTELSEQQAKIDSLEQEKDDIVSELNNCQKILPASVLQLIKNAESGEVEKTMVPVLYSLMIVISHEPIEDNDFLTRFNALDRELYAALWFNESLLAEIRKRIQNFLNAKLKAHQIKWDLIGLPYDEELHMTDDSKGNTIVRVLSALVSGTYSQRATVKTSI